MGEDLRPTRSRRSLLLAAASASVGILFDCRLARANQTPGPYLDGTDPRAQALHYVQDANTVDPKTNRLFKPGSSCSNCLQSHGKAGEAWRPCSIFPGKLVSANGWCQAWMRNPSLG